jgi:hypothetical protein
VLDSIFTALVRFMAWCLSTGTILNGIEAELHAFTRAGWCSDNAVEDLLSGGTYLESRLGYCLF